MSLKAGNHRTLLDINHYALGNLRFTVSHSRQLREQSLTMWLALQQLPEL